MATARPTVNIVIAGKGKYTLLKNLFGEQVEKGEAFSTKNGVKLCFTYVSNLDGENELKDKKGKVHLLVYCLPINPGTLFKEENPRIIEALTKVYGKNIWNNCIIVFTFSNQVWNVAENENESSDQDVAIQKYIGYIDEYATLFGDKLFHLEFKKMKPKSIFNYAAMSYGKLSDGDTIPIIPAGYKAKDPVLPEIKLHGENWVEEVFGEMCNKCEREGQEALKQYRHVEIEDSKGT